MRLRAGGRASHLKPVTRDDLARRYGYFLDFLARSGRLDAIATAGAQVTLANVDPFIAELKARVSSVTLHGTIYKLRRITEIIAPERDLSWLGEIEKDLSLMMKPRPKHGRLVMADVLVEAGLTLMAEAGAADHRTALQRAAQYRNGLMVALLACCPIRLKNFAALTLGQSFVQAADRWWIVLDAAETKEGRADERPVQAFLTDWIEGYLLRHRPVLGRYAKLPKALWLSANDGKPMSYLGVEGTVTKTTTVTVGISISPHLFRASAATSAAIHAGATPHLASAILDHRDPTTTQKHYNRATSLSAGKSYLAVIDSYRARLGRGLINAQP
jgi:site-specific recombinase XerD